MALPGRGMARNPHKTPLMEDYEMPSLDGEGPLPAPAPDPLFCDHCRRTIVGPYVYFTDTHVARCSVCAYSYPGEETELRCHECSWASSTSTLCASEFPIRCDSCQRVSPAFPADTIEEPLDQYGALAGCECHACRYRRNQRNRPAPREEEEEPPEEEIIREYSYKPTPIFRGTGPYFGFEVETEVTTGINERDASEVWRRLAPSCRPHWYGKRDGSLANGVEIVSHPIGLDLIKAGEGPFAWMRVAKTEGLRADNRIRCGGHIHVSREALPEKAWAWMQCFFWTHMNRLTSLSGRRGSANGPTSANYWHFRRRDITTSNLLGGPSSSRHDAINFCGSATVEWRLWQSSLVPEKQRERVGFMVALMGHAHATMEHLDLLDEEGKEASLSWERFALYFVSDQCKDVLGPLWPLTERLMQCV